MFYYFGIIICNLFQLSSAICSDDRCTTKSQCLGGNFTLNTCSHPSTEKGCCLANSSEHQCSSFNYDHLHNCSCDRTHRVRNPLTCNPLIKCGEKFGLNVIGNDFCYGLNRESFYWCCLSKEELDDISTDIVVPLLFAFGMLLLLLIPSSLVIWFKYFKNKVGKQEESLLLTCNIDADNKWKNVLINLIPKVPQSEITFGKEFAQGEFCNVYQARWRDQIVAVKILKDSVKSGWQEMLLNEAAILWKIRLTNSQHLCLFNGIFIDSSLKMGIVMEYMNLGDLKSFLKRKRKQRSAALSISELTHIAMQLSIGFHFLQSLQIIHGDIAARNCLLSGNEQDAGNLIIKISDFGLAKMCQNETDTIVYKADNIMIKLPLKWMAPECFQNIENEEYQFTLSSDKWAFGILLYELFTRGAEPYKGKMDVQTILLTEPTNNSNNFYLKNFPELIKFEEKTTTIHKLIIGCLNVNPKDRMDSKQIFDQLSKLLNDSHQ